MLTIVGKVKQRVIKQVINNYSLHNNQGWFFMDFSPEDIPLNSKFDIMLEGENKRLLPGFFAIKLLACIDQFGNKLSYVPKSYKTICKLEFHPQVPNVIKKLPFLDGWSYNSQAISLVRHEDIELAVPDLVLFDLSSIIYIQFKTTLDKKSIRIIHKSDLVAYFEKFYKPNVHSVNKILSIWVQLGKVTHKNKNEIELVENIG